MHAHKLVVMWKQRANSQHTIVVVLSFSETGCIVLYIFLEKDASIRQSFSNIHFHWIILCIKYSHLKFMEKYNFTSPPVKKYSDHSLVYTSIKSKRIMYSVI